jgi:pSer/pThr/pTyr-binding forkhead associated (FHA) protein
VQQAADNAARGVPTQAVSQPAKSMSQPAVKATEVYMELRAELTVSDGPDRGRHFNLTKPVITIGRSGGRQNDITLSDATVSREHARIVYSASDRTFQLVNESAVNPVLLNGNAVDKNMINDNDTIRMGATTLQFKRT